jgi:uncharacterized protein YecT (DUF1311 family)
MKKSILLVLFVIASFKGLSQKYDMPKIEEMEHAYQNCLDSGVHMLQCSDEFYKKMDNVLNEVYKELRSKLDSSQKVEFRNEQLLWLKKRDRYFTEIHSEVKADGLQGADYQMSVLDKKAEFVKDRIIELMSTK